MVTRRSVLVYLAIKLLVLLVPLMEGQKSKAIIIGGIFGRKSNGTESPEFQAFKLAIDFIKTVEQQGFNTAVSFVGVAEFADPEDDVENIQRAISLIERDAVVIIGPVDVYSLQTIQRLCPEVQVPQIAPLATGLTMSFNPCNFEYLLRMSPDDAPQFNAIADLIDHFKWTKVAVLASRDHEGREGLGSFKDYLELTGRNIKFTSVEYFVPFPDVIRQSVELSLELIKKGGSRVIVLKCRARYVSTVMEEARSMEMVHGWVWIFTDNALDEEYLMPDGILASRDLRGVIGVRQAMGRGLYNQNIAKHWKYATHDQPMKPSVGRVIDGVFVVVEAVQNALRDGVDVTSEKTGLTCNKTLVTKPRPQGRIISKYLRKVRTAGFMNYLSFNEEGAPDNPMYDIVNVRGNGIAKVGEWNTFGGLKMDPDKELTWTSGNKETPRDVVNVLANKTITVVTFKGSPFTMPKRPNITGKVNGSEFEGAAIDLLERLKEILHFDYVIYTSPDGKVGVENEKTGDWDGVIKELIDESADLAVGPITITSQRWSVVEFTQPFMTSGLGVVMATDDSPKPYFRFLEPFRKGLWAMIFGAVLGMAVVNCTFSLVSPFGFYGRCVQPRRKNEVKASYLSSKYCLSFLNSTWSSAAYYLGQGPDGNHPVSASGRAAVAVWWFCITILGATYTANMAAYLTTTRMQTPIRRVEDLAQQTDIAYGVVANSQTQKFFQVSHMPRYQMMWEYIKLRRTLLPNTKAGLNRVLHGKFAFIHDAPVLQYLARKRYCGRMKLIGGYDKRTFGKAHYGFALPKDSPYTNLLSVEILKIQQSGELKNMIEKWMVKKTPCLPLDEVEKQNEKSMDTSKMGIENMLGVFILMLGGIAIGFLLLIIEWIVAACRDLGRTKNNKELFLGFWKAIRNRIVRLYKHRSHTQEKINRQTEGISFKANKATQTSSQAPLPTYPVIDTRVELGRRMPSWSSSNNSRVTLGWRGSRDKRGSVEL